MGVRGLMTFLRDNRQECSETIDLIEIARQRGAIEILTDFYSFEHFAMRQFWAGLCRLRQNLYLPILGGEYDSQEKFFTRVVRELQAVGIHLVFFVDGAKGSSRRQTLQKMHTWQYRHQQDIERLEQHLGVCRGTMSMEALQNTQYVRPVLLETQLFATLAACGCEVVQCPSGEADEVIAKAFFERPNAFCVLSNDTDFCIFPDCRLVLEDLFDIDGYLGLSLPSEQPLNPERPRRLMCGLFSTQKLMQRLGLPLHSQLVEVSIVNGNDFTGHFMKNYYQRIGLPGKRTMLEVAAWVRRHGSLETHPLLSVELKRNREFQQAVQFSRDFYGHPPQPGQAVAEKEADEKGYIATLVENSITKGVFPPSFMAMRQSFYWHRFLVEDFGLGKPCVEVELAPLRQALYRMLLAPNHRTVQEHGRTPYQAMQVTEVVAWDDSSLPSVHQVKPQQVFHNLRTFHYIMSHIGPLPPDQAYQWFDRYGRKTGFKIYLLRYWLLLNWRRNLCVTEAEFLALVATVMGNTHTAACQMICIRPTARCVTLGNWFQDIYRHAYLFLGKLLHLTKEFPTPNELFSGAKWTVFFTCVNTDAWNTSIKMVPLYRLQQVESQMFDIIREHRHILQYVIEDIPDFDSRF